MLEVGAKIKMIKPIGCFCMPDTIFTVRNIVGELIEFVTNFGIGYMTNDEFNEYFKTVKVWTPWIETETYSYKTDNEKYVKVRMGNCKSKSSCHPCDEFDLNTGINIALQNILTKNL